MIARLGVRQMRLYRVRTLGLVTALLIYSSVNAESVPLVRDHGIFVVPALVNNSITLKFTIDSGAADVSLPEDVVSTLIRTGSIQKTDFLEAGIYQLADGTTQTERRFRIRSLRIGTLEFHNVTASVAPTAGTLLLGQSFLTKLSSWTIDNQRGVVILNGTAPSGADSGKSTEPELPPQATQWKLMSKGANGTELYVDILSARAVEGKRRVWEKSTFPPQLAPLAPGDPRWVTTVIVQFDFDCTARSSEQRAGYLYYNDGSDFTQPSDVLMASHVVLAGSTEARVLAYVCGE